jgi:TRAP-type C4-dicarboxylate transport system permease small subunit
MLDRLIDRCCKLIEMITVACLATMVGLVLANVILRYAFNSGITVAEELSRWIFVWTTFLGSVVALREHGHLGTEFLVGRLGPTGRRICLAIGYMLMLFVCWLIFEGALAQTRLNWRVSAPSSGASLAWFYSAGVVFAIAAAVILLHEFYRLLSGRLRDEQLVIIKENEDQA